MGQWSRTYGYDARHRDKNGEIGRKCGDTLIRMLRKTYGPHFADGCRDDDKLSDVLHKMASLSMLLHDHERGKLDEICRSAV